MMEDVAGMPVHGEQPLLSVVTIAYQCRSNLAETIASVAAQTVADFEYIVVDGGSTDGSPELLASSARIDRWVSERDRGIYDAMNRGVAMATGRYICFMNAGDRFANVHAVETVLAYIQREPADVVYGNAIVEYADGSQLTWVGGTPCRLPLGMIASHQATFARREDLLRLPFRLDRSASDFEFLLRVWREGKRFAHLDAVIARVAAGGVSDVMRGRSVRERWSIVRECGLGSASLSLHYAYTWLRASLSSRAHRVLPPTMIRFLRTMSAALRQTRTH